MGKGAVGTPRSPRFGVKASYTRPSVADFSHHAPPEVYDLDEIAATAERIRSFLVSFKIVSPGYRNQVIREAKAGASTIQYVLELEPGVAVQRLKNRVDDLRLHLRDGRAQVSVSGQLSIDVPKAIMPEITLLDVLKHPKTTAFKGNIPLVLGRSSDGEPVLVDLVEAPHILIAGASNSGKSVALINIIQQLMLRFTPDELALTLIDAKQTEFTPYAGLPHLDGGHVIVDPHEAATKLAEIDAERQERNAVLAANKVSKMSEYLELCRAKGWTPEIKWRVVIIDEIDELTSGLNTSMNRETGQSERSLTYGHMTAIARAARTAGVHMVIATQRPKADILPTQMTANFPVRIALFCADARSSAQILGEGHGEAETLQERGDAYVKSESGMVRMRGTWVKNEHRDKLISFWKAQA